MAANDNGRRLAIVTGADGGIGMEFCRELGRRGFDLLMAGIRREPLLKATEEIASAYGVEAHPLVVDLTAPDATKTVTDALDSLGRDPWLLINNAGIFSFAPLCETPQGKRDCFIALHVKAVTDLSVVIGQRMAAAGGGRILNMSSMSCWMPMPGIALYSATKAYIRVISRALHYELRDSGVTVTVACPGGIATDLFGLPDNLKRLAVAIGALSTPSSFARKAVKRALKGKKQYVNGVLNHIAIPLVAMTPTRVRMLIKHRMLDRGIRR